MPSFNNSEEYKPRRSLTLVEVEKWGQTSLSLYCSGRQLYNLKALKRKLLSKILPPIEIFSISPLKNIKHVEHEIKKWCNKKTAYQAFLNKKKKIWSTSHKRTLSWLSSTRSILFYRELGQTNCKFIYYSGRQLYSLKTLKWKLK